MGKINQEVLQSSERQSEERPVESPELSPEIDLENPDLISTFDTNLDLAPHVGMADFDVPVPASEESSNAVVRRLTPPLDGSKSVWSSNVLLPLPQLDVCRPPLHLSASKGNVSMTRLLLERGANTAIQDSMGQTALHLAVEQGQTKVVQLLLTCAGKETVNVRDSIGRTALFKAVESGHSDIVRALLKASIDVNARDIYGHAALHPAVESGSESLTILLLSSGADINS